MKAIILAGGSGERFWPESTDIRPKQFLTIYGGTSLLRRSVDRLLERFSPTDIYIITSETHTRLSRSELPMLPSENIIGEPVQRNTAPACAVGARLAGMDEIMLVIPADHLIENTKGFWRSCDRAFEVAEKTDSLVTFGIRPTRPETGFGYIEAGAEIAEKVRKVDRFVEKPDQAKAEEFLSSGRFFWNSGMFVWRGGAFMEELRKFEPGIHSAISNIEGFGPRDLGAVYPDMKKISVDHAVMERSDRVQMVEAEFDWSDMGSWSTISEIEGPSVTGDSLYVEGKDVYVRPGTGRPIAVIGLSEIIVIDSPGGLLVCSSNSAQSVRGASAHFRKVRDEASISK
jgi:mannose-1-phosphate guanylyltransferase